MVATNDNVHNNTLCSHNLDELYMAGDKMGAI